MGLSYDFDEGLYFFEVSVLHAAHTVVRFIDGLIFWDDAYSYIVKFSSVWIFDVYN